MEHSVVIWIHPASFTYRSDKPEHLFETIWADRPGWGFLRATDLWIRSDESETALLSKGYIKRLPTDDPSVTVCKTCGMYLCAIPGSLVNKHFSQCVNTHEDQRVLEEFVLDEHRMRRFAEMIRAEKLREKLHLEAADRRERTERMRGEMFVRQAAKDRKKMLKQEARDQLKDD